MSDDGGGGPGSPGAGPPLDTPAAPQSGRVAAEFLGQAGLIAMISGFRYWRRLARMGEEHLSLAARMGVGGAQGMSEEERRVLADELRGLARELGEAASQEARRFRADLERLALGLAAPETPAGSAPRRHARAKP